MIIVELIYEDGNNMNFKEVGNKILYFLKLIDRYAKIKIIKEKQSWINKYNFKTKISFSSRIQKVLSFVCENYRHVITLSETAKIICVSKFYFEKIFSSEIGIPFKKYLNIFRLYKGAEILRSNDGLSVTDVCFDIGFNDLSNFIRKFKYNFGCSPKKFSNCSNNPNKCILRQKSFFFNNKDNKLNSAMNFRLKDGCYIKRK